MTNATKWITAQLTTGKMAINGEVKAFPRIRRGVTVGYAVRVSGVEHTFTTAHGAAIFAASKVK